MGARRLSICCVAGIFAAAATAACVHRPGVSATTWPPPCAGTAALEVNNPTTYTLDAVWGSEHLGSVGPGISRLPVPNIELLDPNIVGGPIFRVQDAIVGVQGRPLRTVRHRLVCL